MSEIVKAILDKLFRCGCIGAGKPKHTALENLPRGFPRHLHKEVMKTTKRLIKKGFIVKKPTSYGLQVYLNIYMKSAIEEIIKDP